MTSSWPRVYPTESIKNSSQKDNDSSNLIILSRLEITRKKPHVLEKVKKLSEEPHVLPNKSKKKAATIKVVAGTY
jgi:hypothetical protein